MRQFRRQTPTPTLLTALRALAGVLVAAAVLSAPVRILAAQPAEAPRPAARAAAPAQAAPPAQAPAPAPAPVLTYEGDRRNADETRDRLRQVIEQYSPSLFEVFKNDPSLLLNDQYLANYPGLAAFLQQHPEVGHNPGYFVGEPQWSRNRDPRMATIDAARAMGLGGEIGSLEAGKRADVAVVRLGRLHTTPAADVVSALVYGAEANDVDTVIIDGRLVMRDTKLLTLDEGAVVAEAAAEAKELSNRA